MTNTPSPEPTATPEPPPAVEVDVARTGGIAGITRRWSAQPPEDEASDWISLIDRCPWNEAGTVGEPLETDRDADSTDAGRRGADARPAPARPAGAAGPTPDGFVWFIRAAWSGTDPREAELPDDAVVGAWRELVDAVRDWSRQSAGPGSRGR